MQEITSADFRTFCITPAKKRKSSQPMGYLFANTKEEHERRQA
jgi:hypothetical protein